MRSVVCAVELLAEDLLLERLELLLERVDDRQVLVDDEVHQRVEHEARPLAEELRCRLAAGAHGR